MDTLNTNTNAPKGGSSLAVIIVILIIALGGAYFWYSRSSKAPTIEDNKMQKSVSDDTLQKDLEASSNVDISADLNGLDQVYK